MIRAKASEAGLRRGAAPAPAPDATPGLWAVVLAGGRGARLAPLVERVHADGRPKQFAVLHGSRSLLRRTLDRTELAIPPERTVVVATRSHARFLADEFPRRDAPKLLVQPNDIGTAAGVLLPVAWIAARDPDAIVAVFPSDHFIGDDRAFMGHIAALAAAATRHPARILLAGARPDSPETGYGWMEPGESLDGGLRRVRRFWEKPDAETANACLARGCLWNTFVMVATARAMRSAGKRALPGLHAALAPIRSSVGGACEDEAIERAYAAAPAANFSERVLGALPTRLAVSALPPVSWSDWGTPERVLKTLRREGIAPRWLTAPAPTA